MKVRRPEHAFVRFSETQHISIEGLLRGEVKTVVHPDSLASTPTVRGEVSVSGDELLMLSKVPSGHWVSAAEIAQELGLDQSAVQSLIEKGLLLSDADDDASEIDQHVLKRHQDQRLVLHNQHALSRHRHVFL